MISTKRFQFLFPLIEFKLLLAIKNKLTILSTTYRRKKRFIKVFCRKVKIGLGQNKTKQTILGTTED